MVQDPTLIAKHSTFLYKNSFLLVKIIWLSRETLGTINLFASTSTQVHVKAPFNISLYVLTSMSRPIMASISQIDLLFQ